MWFTDETIYSLLPIALQEALVARHGRRIHRERFGPECDRLSSFLAESEWYDADRLRAYQDSRLRDLVAHAYGSVPYYRDLMDKRHVKPSDIATAADLVKLPLLTKEDVRKNGDRLISQSVKRKSLRPAVTSGTTSSPVIVYWDRGISQMNHACYLRVRRWAGVPFGRRYATLQGRIMVPTRQRKPPFWRHNPAWNQLFLSPLHMSSENLPHYVAEIRRFGAESLEGYPTCIYILARFLVSRDDHLPLSCVVTTGEPLLPFERDIIEERFRTKVFDAYGQAERVAFSSECERHEGLHLFEEYGITEFVNERGEPVDVGTPGLVVGTTLHNFGMPLIRYAMGDVAARSARVCSCGRGLPLSEGLTTRGGDILVSPDGRLVPPIMVTWAVRMFRSVINWQIVQENTREILVRVVTEQPVSDDERAKVSAYFARRLGPTVRVRVERVAEIDRTARGKTRHVISDVAREWWT
jgi:phenylacetate-CoA ligase